MELPCLDVGIKRHIDGAGLAAEDPELCRRPVFLQHRRPEKSLDLGLIEADQPIDALGPDRGRVAARRGRSKSIGRWSNRLVHRSRMRCGLRRWHHIGSAGLERAARPQFRRRL